jgi:hypothetical protein
MSGDTFHVGSASGSILGGQNNSLINAGGRALREAEVERLLVLARRQVMELSEGTPGRTALATDLTELETRLEEGAGAAEVGQRLDRLARAAQILGLAQTAAAVAEAVKKLFV